jgi:tricorn protease
MRRSALFPVAILALLIFVTLAPQAQPVPIHGARFPALSPDGSRICFSYLGDLWTASSDGGSAARLTLHEAYDGYPRWSPDGNWIAFSSNREGNFDVFIVPARGGAARQLTFHSADDIVCDWSPDGTKVLFQSARESRYTDLYTISVVDGALRRITRDKTHSRYGVFSPDGKAIAYVRGGQLWWRPAYKGSTNGEVYSIPAAGGQTTRWTTYDGVDMFPNWSRDGKSLLIVTNREGGRANLYRLPAPGAKPERITHETADDVRFPTESRDGSRIVYETDFRLFTTSAAGTNAKSPEFYAPSDTLTNLTQRTTFNNGLASLSLSDDGNTFAFAARGEIWTLPVDGGDAERITKNGSAEYSPSWSPDGSRMVYTTDRNGNLDVCLYDTKAKAETVLTSDAADETNSRYSPTGKLVAYVRSGGSTPGLYVLPFKDGTAKASDAVVVGPGYGVGSYDWSPDGRWLVYSKRDSTGTTDLWIVPTVGGTPVNVTRYPGVNTNPQWSRDGRNVVYLSNRTNPAGQFGMNLYALRLIPEPPSDETSPQGSRRRGADESGEPEAQFRRRQAPPPTEGPTPPPNGAPGLPFTMVPPRANNVAIEFEHIENRSRPLTSSPSGIVGATLSPDSRTVVYAMNMGGQADWWAQNIQSSQTMRITSGAETGGSLEFSPDASKAYFLGNGGIRFLGRGQGGSAAVNVNAAMTMDRRVEVAEAFNEAWRTLRTRFYDPKFHGVDWLAVRKRFEPVLSETATKEDFSFVLQQMIGELNASHMGSTPPASPNATTTAYLGLGFDQDYSGPGLKVNDVTPEGPADQVGRHVAMGEYVLAIDGDDVRWTESLYKTLTDKADKTVELLVNNKPTKEGARTVKVKAINRAALDELEYNRWVDQRKKKVDSLSGGQLAYHHIKAMDQPSLERFRREVFGDDQSKKGLVIDVRFNGGGRIHDELFSYLTRRAHVYETPRDGDRSTQPFQLWERPLVLLINEQSASDAEIFPNGFRFYGLGKIVGVPTYGGVIGTNDITLVDGTRFRIPTTGWTTVDGRNLENWGVPPDIRVEMSPEDYARDDDKQLTAAVKTLMESVNAKR